MKRLSMMAATVAALLMSGLNLAAHDDRLHGPNAITGQIVAVSAEGLSLKTKTDTVKVKYSSKTKFELATKAVDKSRVKQGDRAGVVGSRLPTGEWMANEVILGLPEPKPVEKKAAEHKH